MEVAPVIEPAVDDASSRIGPGEPKAVSLMKAILSLRKIDGLADSVESRVTNRVAAAVTGGPITEEGMALVRDLSQFVGLTSLETLGAAVAGVSPPPFTPNLPRRAIDPAPFLRAQLATQITLRRAAKALGEQAPSMVVVPLADVQSRLAQDDMELLDWWFHSGPTLEEGWHILDGMSDDQRTRIKPAILAWTKELTPEQRTDLLTRWIGDATDLSGWVERIGEQGVDEATFVSEVGRRLQAGGTADVRMAHARNIAALRPEDPRAQQQVADIVIARLDIGTEADADVARRLFPALGRNHRSTGRLGDAVERSVQKGKLKLTGKDRDALRASGIKVKEPSLFGFRSKKR